MTVDRYTLEEQYERPEGRLVHEWDDSHGVCAVLDSMTDQSWEIVAR